MWGCAVIVHQAQHTLLFIIFRLVQSTPKFHDLQNLSLVKSGFITNSYVEISTNGRNGGLVRCLFYLIDHGIRRKPWPVDKSIDYPSNRTTEPKPLPPELQAAIHPIENNDRWTK